jgi:O-antigen ligase
MKHIYILLVLATYFFTPFESVSLWEGFSIVKLIVVLLIICSLFNLKYFDFRAKSKFIPLILIYFFFCVLSVFWSIDQESTFSVFIDKIIPFCILTILLNWSIDGIKMINKISWSYILGVFIVCIYTYINFKTYMGDIGYRSTALEQDQNELGFLVNMGIVFALYLLGNFDNKKIKILLWTFIVIFAFTILSTGSRTGFVVLLLIFAVWLLGRNVKRIIPSLAILFAAAIIYISVIPTEIFERLLETRSQIEAANFTNRGDIWKNGLQAWQEKDAFLLGTGNNTWSTLYGAKHSLVMTSHNSYIQTLVELGVIGLILFLSIYFYLFKKAWYLCRKFDTVYLLFILPLLVTMLTLGTTGRRWVFLFGILIVKFIQYQKFIDNKKTIKQ